MSEETQDILIVISDAIRGDTQAIDWLIRSYQKRIAAFILGTTGEPASVDDLLQTTFIKMAISISKLRDPLQFERWLFQIARNVCMSHLRKRKLLRIFESFRPSFHDRAEEEKETSTPLHEELQNALRQLPPHQRELLCLVQQADYSYEELAQITGNTVNSVRNNLHRAKESIRRLVHE